MAPLLDRCKIAFGKQIGKDIVVVDAQTGQTIVRIVLPPQHFLDMRHEIVAFLRLEHFGKVRRPGERDARLARGIRRLVRERHAHRAANLVAHGLRRRLVNQLQKALRSALFNHRDIVRIAMPGRGMDAKRLLAIRAVADAPRMEASFAVAGRHLAAGSADLKDLYEWLGGVNEQLSNKQQKIAAEILKEIRSRLQFLLDVGLDYLSLNRSTMSLSGGESQRIRLATQIGAKLVNVLYILDEPSIGLHQRDNQRLINSLKMLRDEGNTVIVVEHDKDMMLAADYIIDMGPLAGRKGGEVMFQGTPEELMKTDTLTAKYLRDEGEYAARVHCADQDASAFIRLNGCHGNNLKNVSVSFPLRKLICITGVSGSGKSTLINDTLQPILSQHLYRSLREPLAYDSVEGLEYINKVVTVDQSPIGRTPRSNPATYTGVFSDIRDLFVKLPEAVLRGYKPGRFSFNVSGGRCEACGGNGYKTIAMNFLPDVLSPCEVCHGKRYNRETCEVKFKGKSIADVLDMTINHAVEFFENQPHILNKIKVIQDVGLGYIKLGQPSTTLSGGESQRVKLATELSRKDTGNTLYILDEPTTGLHSEDIKALMAVLYRLVEKGNTVIVIEHNLEVINQADYIIDMGPEGGKDGGRIVAQGTLDDVRASRQGYTWQFL